MATALTSRQVALLGPKASSQRVAFHSRPRPFTPARHVLAKAANATEAEESRKEFGAELEDIMEGVMDTYGTEVDDEYEDDDALEAADEAAALLAATEDIELAISKDMAEGDEKQAAEQAVARRVANALYKVSSGVELTGADLLLLEEATEAAEQSALEVPEVEEVIPPSGFGRAALRDDEDTAISRYEKSQIGALKLSKLELRGLVPKDWDQVQTEFFSSKKGINVPLPEYKLNIIWMEKNIGVAIDQVYSRGQTSPLTEYFFWPRTDAWEDLKNALEQRPWVPEREKVILLNRLTQLINYWQADQKPLLEEARVSFPDCAFQAS